MRTLALAFGAPLVVAAVVMLVPSLRQRAMDSLPPAWHAGIASWRHGVRVEHDLRLAMPDGVSLAASLYRPQSAVGPLPTVLIRVPYHRRIHSEGWGYAIFFAARGYAVLVQDLRGTGDSGGELLPWRDAQQDGVATLDWIARQPWSTGKIGTFGCSALGETQFPLARSNHPAHAAMIASGAGGAVGSAAGRYSYFGLFEGGIFQLASGFGWFVESGAKNPAEPPAEAFDRVSLLRQLPVSGLVSRVRTGASGYSDFLATPLSDPNWASWGYLTDNDKITTPALIINTWGDQTVGDALAYAEQSRRANARTARDQRVIVGPGKHCGHLSGAQSSRFGDLPMSNAFRPWQTYYASWFAHWLKGEGDGLAAMKPYTVFMLGENRWIESEAWPPAQARLTRWYLASGGRANSRSGDGRLEPVPPNPAPADRYSYDPANPVPTRGGPVCCTGDPAERSGPVDQAEVESREDVLVYTSAPLEADLRIAGPLKAHLAFSSDAPDTDLVLRLTHVRPDGLSTNIQEGALRLRYRDGYAHPVMMAPGRRYEVEVDLRSIAYAIPRGHRLRLHVTSSSFPRLERNLNTGAARNADETAMAIAVNAVHHDDASRSWVELPVLPAGR